jgi:hypothetical protein
MEDQLLFFAGIVAGVVMVFTAFLGWIDRRKPHRKERLRRGTGNALLGLQRFTDPSVEHVFQAQNVEQKDEDADEGLGGDEEDVRSDLAESLSRAPVDPEEVRRHLVEAVRLGLDWRALFEEAVADELRERPFRAPSLPQARRVAPRV